MTLEGRVENGAIVLQPPTRLPEGTRVRVEILPDTESILFDRLVRQWKAERGPSSSARRMAQHPAYRAIVAMGKTAVPLLLAELERQPDHWFVALHELTGADPVPKEARGRMDEMAAAWIKWGRENGFVS